MNSQMNSLNENSSKWIWIGIGCLLCSVFIILTSEVMESLRGKPELIGTIDSSLTQLLVKHRTPTLSSIMIVLTQLGSGELLAALTLAFCSYLFTKKKFKEMKQLLMVSIGSSLLTVALKNIFERNRPDEVLNLVGAGGYSYPSGHSLASSAIYFTFAILLSKLTIDFKKQTYLWFLTFTIIFTVALTRVYLGVHYFSDVLAGVLIGVAWASLNNISQKQMQIVGHNG